MAAISVIIPVYNSEKYLRRCLDSIIRQSYNDLEIILVNDGSMDTCPLICDEYAEKDSRFKVIHQENGGVCKARNTGLKIATGEFIHFVDSDDFLADNFYSDLYSLAENTGSEIVCSSFFKEQTDGKFVPYVKKEEDLLLDRISALIELVSSKRIWFSLWDKLFSRQIIKGIRFNENICHNEDFLFCYEAFKRANKIAYTSRPYYHYCNNPTSAVRSKFSHKRMTAIDAHELVLKDLKHNFPTLYNFAKAEFFKVVIYTRNLMIKADYSDKDDINRLKLLLRHNLIFIFLSHLSFGYKRLALQYSL